MDTKITIYLYNSIPQLLKAVKGKCIIPTTANLLFYILKEKSIELIQFAHFSNINHMPLVQLGPSPPCHY